MFIRLFGCKQGYLSHNSGLEGARSKVKRSAPSPEYMVKQLVHNSPANVSLGEFHFVHRISILMKLKSSVSSVGIHAWNARRTQPLQTRI